LAFGIEEELMDGNRFDAFSRSLADRSSRRGALRRLGGGGLGAALLGMTGMRAAAQDDEDDEETTCRLVLVATVAVGPNKDTVYEGDLEMVIGDNGAIDEGTLTTKDGDEYELVGQATGRAINLRITIDDGQYLSLTGTSQQRITRCRGGIDGTFGGPHTGDLGTWYAAQKKRAENATVIATTGNGNGNGNGTGGSNPTEEPDEPDEPTVTPTPCDSTGIDCGSTFVLDPATCECVCPNPYKRCGESCCFGGAVCYDAGGCGCPDGYEPCQEVCTESCPSGQYLDADSCQCTAQTSCGSGETLCNGQCVSIDCASNQLFDDASCQCVARCSSGMDYCNDVCIDIVNDAMNCGSCGNACPAGMPCIAGACTCPVDYTYCASTQKCITGSETC
jgi:hypothetical protein